MADDLAAHHVLDDVARCEISPSAPVWTVRAVAQDGDAVADGAEFFQAVGDVDDAHARAPAASRTMRKTSSRLGAGERRSGLVEDQQARSVLDGAADLDHLLAGGTQTLARATRRAAETMLLDQPAARSRRHSRAVQPSPSGSAILAPEEDIFRDGQMRRQQRFLVHHGDADAGGFGGSLERDLAAVPQHAAASRSSIPATIFMSVDLPAPFSPSSRCTSPASTDRLPSRSAVTPPKRLVMP